MNKVILRKSNRERRKLRVRKKVFGTAEQPRLTVFRSLRCIYAQLIDDTNSKTLAYAGPEKGKGTKKGTKIEKAFEVGKELAKIALEKGIKEAVFDRNGYQYHGRVQKLADGAREGGLKF